MRTERVSNDIFIELESTNDFSYFVLMKKVTKIHFCVDGFFMTDMQIPLLKIQQKVIFYIMMKMAINYLSQLLLMLSGGKR